MFLSQNSILWEEFRKYEKTLLSYAMNSIKKYFFEKKFLIPEKKYFYKCKKISIDDAIMERSKKLLVIPTNIGWTDVGSWRNIWSIGNKDQNKNVLEGDAHIIDSKNCYVRSSSKLTIAAGVKNLAIITTEDAVLVLDKDTFSKSRSISNLLKAKRRQEHNSTVLVYKPWGTYKTILKGKNYQVKEIVINPESSISLQKHKYRSEHWIIVEGEGLITHNNQKITLSVNQEIFIPKGTKHRITNKKKSSLKFIEVQIGKYLGEDDIIRYVDQYGRV
jgi:mannose-1-phosphate guanylyltransferase/mannose-6-phosphate isomerase